MERKKQCWVYVLVCRDGSYYTGWTNDLAKRVMTHQAGKGGKYTRSRLPVRLIMKWKAKNRNEAMGREARFKSLNRREKEKVLKSRR
jgi:putative endonuclease